MHFQQKFFPYIAVLLLLVKAWLALRSPPKEMFEEILIREQEHVNFLQVSTSVLLQTGVSKSRAAAFIDWSSENKLPPWMSSITEGSDQAVAVVLGQSLNPDGSAPQVLVDRARKAKELLDQKVVLKVIVSGGDAAGVGRTEASLLAKVLMDVGIQKEDIIQESQATTTAENAWFTLRWIPKGTGQLYIVTSDFHMARATYIFSEVFNYFYKLNEDNYRHDPRWANSSKVYPRLELVQAPVRSFCGSDASLNRDWDKAADINTRSLAQRAKDELGFLGSGEVTEALFGEPLSNIMYIWPIQINVTKDAENADNFNTAIAQAKNVAMSLCVCKSPPERLGAEISYPLTFPISSALPNGMTVDDLNGAADCAGRSSEVRTIPSSPSPRKASKLDAEALPLDS